MITNLLCITVNVSIFGIIVGIFDMIERERKIKKNEHAFRIRRGKPTGQTESARLPQENQTLPVL